MVTKTFINNCLYFLNKIGYKYTNVSYGVTRFDNFVSLSFQIWDTNRNIIIKTFVANVCNERTFTSMQIDINKFIEENNKLLCQNLKNL